MAYFDYDLPIDDVAGLGGLGEMDDVVGRLASLGIGSPGEEEQGEEDDATSMLEQILMGVGQGIGGLGGGGGGGQQRPSTIPLQQAGNPYQSLGGYQPLRLGF